ncbi:hypothetical protein CPL00259L_CDS0024 [Escherichia phage McMelon]
MHGFWSRNMGRARASEQLRDQAGVGCRNYQTGSRSNMGGVVVQYSVRYESRFCGYSGRRRHYGRSGDPRQREHDNSICGKQRRYWKLPSVRM